MTTLITGSSRGIGFALTTEALKKGQTVLAVARSIEKLKPLQRDYPDHLKLVHADVSQPSGIKLVVEAVAKHGSLDTLINNAGVLKSGVTVEDFTESFHVNAIVPFELTKALMPALQKSKEPRVVQISTMMASIADNSSGGNYAYRSSKAALNMITKCLTIEFPNVRFALIHPGWVKTDMGGSSAPTETTESARGIWTVIEAMTVKNSGAFKDFKGATLPW